MSNIFRILVTAFAIALPAFGHDPITTNLTWTKEISRLVNAHCASCHRPGGSAMSLLTYEEARPWAKAIRNQVLERLMPPWDAVKGVGEFRGDPSLTPAQMDLFVSWVEGGAPEGNPIYLPHGHATEPSEVAPANATASFPLTRSTTLARPMMLLGIRPEGSLEIAAALPDRSVKRLIWIKEFHPSWNRTYWLQEPLALPQGTRLLLYSKANAAARLFTSPAPAR